MLVAEISHDRNLVKLSVYQTLNKRTVDINHIRKLKFNWTYEFMFEYGKVGFAILCHDVFPSSTKFVLSVVGKKTCIVCNNLSFNLNVHFLSTITAVVLNQPLLTGIRCSRMNHKGAILSRAALICTWYVAPCTVKNLALYKTNSVLSS